MAGLIPFNRRNSGIARTGFEDFYNMLDDFFSEGFMPGRSLVRDTFKIDVQEMDKEYLIEAELPGIRKEEIELNVDKDELCISVNRSEELNKDSKGYIHRERRCSSMSRRIRLASAKPDEIKAKLEEGVLTVIIPKREQSEASRKIEIE